MSTTCAPERPVKLFNEFTAKKHHEVSDFKSPITPRQIVAKTMPAEEIQKTPGIFAADGIVVPLDEPLQKFPEEATYIKPIMGG